MQPPPSLSKSSREIRFATFLVGLLPRLSDAVQDGSIVRCFHKGAVLLLGYSLGHPP